MTNIGWKTYFTGTYEQIVEANYTINQNCGFPDPQTETWDIPTQAYEQDFWFILMPPPDGYKNEYCDMTQEQMIDGVQDVSIEESQPDWWPPFPPI
jgi:hypothetical protein